MKRAATQVDALIASFPKCGRTWLRFALANYLAEAFELGVTPDLHSMFGIIPNFDGDPARGLPSFAHGGVRPKMPLICVTHAAAAITPAIPVIFLVRDARDVVVSNYFHSTRHKRRFSGTISEFIQEPTHGLSAYIHYLNAWADFLSETPHHVTSYELMSASGKEELAKILRFLAVPIDEGALSLALNRSAFNSMHARERAEGIPAHDYDRSDRESMRMRKGVAHGFRDYLTPAQVEEVDRCCREQLSAEALAILLNYSADEEVCREAMFGRRVSSLAS